MTAPAQRAGAHELLRRLAQAGFWLFLIKGLLWIALPALALVAGGQLDWF